MHFTNGLCRVQIRGCVGLIDSVSMEFELQLATLRNELLHKQITKYYFTVQVGKEQIFAISPEP